MASYYRGEYSAIFRELKKLKSEKSQIESHISDLEDLLRANMGGRKWEELDADCLANVFARVGMGTLLLDVPLVCKSWYKATLSPLSWQHLAFPPMPIYDFEDYSDSHLVKRFWRLVFPSLFSHQPWPSHIPTEFDSHVTAFIKSIVKRSDQSATLLVPPLCCTEKALCYIATECPNLRVFALPEYLDQSDPLLCKIPSLVSKWKSLEILELGSKFKMLEILAQVSIHCKNFVGFAVWEVIIGEDEASAIVTMFPKMKYLGLRHVAITPVILKMILQRCKELVYFDCRHCLGFEEDDDEILKLASCITTFRPNGSSRIDDNDYHDDDNICYCDDVDCPYGPASFIDHCCSYMSVV